MLTEKKCEPCQGGVPPLTPEQCKPLLEQLDGWRVVENHHLEKEFSFDDFVGALSFVNKLGALAEEEGHHPDITFGWGYAEVTIQTHKIDGLHENDYILAAKLNEV